MTTIFTNCSYALKKSLQDCQLLHGLGGEAVTLSTEEVYSQLVQLREAADEEEEAKTAAADDDRLSTTSSVGSTSERRLRPFHHHHQSPHRPSARTPKSKSCSAAGLSPILPVSEPCGYNSNGYSSSSRRLTTPPVVVQQRGGGYRAAPPDQGQPGQVPGFIASL